MQFKPLLLELRKFLQRLVDEVLSATNRRCPIDFLLAEIPSAVLADERLLQHIFTNVLVNAVKYSDEVSDWSLLSVASICMAAESKWK